MSIASVLFTWLCIAIAAPPNVDLDAMASLDVLLLRGSKSGDPAVNLEELRYEVLVNGIPSKTDGMVRPTLA